MAASARAGDDTARWLGAAPRGSTRCAFDLAPSGPIASVRPRGRAAADGRRASASRAGSAAAGAVRGRRAGAVLAGPDARPWAPRCWLPSLSGAEESSQRVAVAQGGAALRRQPMRARGARRLARRTHCRRGAASGVLQSAGAPPCAGQSLPSAEGRWSRRLRRLAALAAKAARLAQRRRKLASLATADRSGQRRGGGEAVSLRTGASDGGIAARLCAAADVLRIQRERAKPVQRPHSGKARSAST